MIKAILFDFDGTLVNSESLHYESWNQVLAAYNIRLSEEDYLHHFAGFPTPQNAVLLRERYDLEPSIQELVKQKEQQTELLGATVTIPFMPFALDIIKIFKQKFPLAIVTGSPRSEMEPVLKRAGIFRNFMYTITRDDVKNSKPDPEPYVKCVAYMGFKREEYVVFEDTSSGVRSAKGASLRCFGIQKSDDLRIQLDAAGADQTFANLEEAYDYLTTSGLL